MVWKPEPNSKATTVLRLLAEGPATAREIADETGWPAKLVAAHLSQHKTVGRVATQRFYPHRHGKAWLWSLTESGSTYLASIAPGEPPAVASGPAPTS